MLSGFGADCQKQAAGYEDAKYKSYPIWGEAEEACKIGRKIVDTYQKP
jgi:viroplasmin and RNaseH domain-containing protein